MSKDMYMYLLYELLFETYYVYVCLKMTLKVVDKWQKIQSVKYWLVVHFYVQKYLLYHINFIKCYTM